MTIPNEADRRSDLPKAEKTLLWCIRAWVISLSDRSGYADRIEATFEKLGISETVADLHGLMVATGRGARRVIEINCICSPGVGADERRLLDAIALQQRENHEDAFDILTGFMTEAAALDACDHISRLALALSAAGHVFKQPHQAAWQGWDSGQVMRSYALH
ncbi:hypothetical protein K2X14_04765 [Acetobacter sp. TBRC 12305]|uniref:Uncharacterized protein n=1 Tax=Acetobacter garciniae TaxID=2817435 RepID=A0A939HNW3_9PROT|nr:hypothetical protein [Acetobacter garciniae]MBO1324466.1 hypothetical protein [Acetobacter garciniae]MBX0344155.1 hypothetical protein [Acetobacter garciniae]